MLCAEEADGKVSSEHPLALGATVQVGRGKNPLIQTEDKTVSRLHATFARSDAGEVTVVAHSSKGVLVYRGGGLVAEELAKDASTRLQCGDGVRLIEAFVTTIRYRHHVALVTNTLRYDDVARYPGIITKLGCRVALWNVRDYSKARAAAKIGVAPSRLKKRKREEAAAVTGASSASLLPLSAFSRVVVGNGTTVSKLSGALGSASLPAAVAVVREDWVKACWQQRSVLEEVEEFRALPDPIEPPVGSAGAASSSSRPLGELEGFTDIPKFACQRPTPLNHLHNDITDLLDEMSAFYRADGDEKRALAFSKGSSIVKYLKRRLKTQAQVKALQKSGCGVGDKVAAAIWEILKTGTFERLEAFRDNKEQVAKKALCLVHDVGPSTASEWYQKGALDAAGARQMLLDGELEEATDTQKVALQWHDDLQNHPIYRTEAEEIYALVKGFAEAAAHELDPDASVQAELTGGYKRGKLFGHDTDVLLTVRGKPGPNGEPATHPDHKEVCQAIRRHMTDARFLTHTFHSGKFRVKSSDTSSRFESLEVVMGIVEHHGRKRRVDVVVVRPAQWAAADLGWTGNTLFERSLREYAEKRKLKFSQLGLCHREGSEEPVDPTETMFKTDADYFRYLELEYIPPHLRNM